MSNYYEMNRRYLDRITSPFDEVYHTTELPMVRAHAASIALALNDACSGIASEIESTNHSLNKIGEALEKIRYQLEVNGEDS